MAKKLINVGTEDYSLWIPAGIPVSVFGLDTPYTPSVDDMDKLIMLKTRIVCHDGSGNKYDSPLLAHKVVKLIEDSNNDIE